VYLAFGLLCSRRQVRAALLLTGDQDPEAHYALHDVLATVCRTVGVPLYFRLALVAAPSCAAVCSRIERDLVALGCEARLFGSEAEARAWLAESVPEAGPRPAARPLLPPESGVQAPLR
jgi:hypothetical protein